MLSDNLDLETGSICWPGKRCHSRDLQLFQYPFLKQLQTLAMNTGGSSNKIALLHQQCLH